MSEAGQFGRFFEDFVVGDVYRHPLGRTITTADNTWFTLLTMNTNQLHFNAHYAASSRWGRELVNSGLTVAMVLGLSVSDVSQHAIANLGWDEIELVHPVFVGDTLYAESLVLEVRKSESQPDGGIVTVYTRGINQEGVDCVTFTRSALVQKREGRDPLGHFPAPAVEIGASREAKARQRASRSKRGSAER